MESPVVLDKPPEYHGIDDRGFPFEEEEGSGAWSDLAARHPDIAARLRQHPAAANWARKRRPASHDADDFGDRFNDFDRFPFHDIPPEFREHFPSHFNRRFGTREDPPPQNAHQSPQPQTSQPPPQQQTIATQTEQDPPGPLPTVPTQEAGIPQYGLRNTVDLGQKSATDPSLVDADERNQRSVSAPPESREPVRRMSAQEPPPAEQPGQHKVRHIPILVEGRDQPVINDGGSHFADGKPAHHPQQPPLDSSYFQEEPSPYHQPSHFSKAFGTPISKHYRQGQPFAQTFARGASPGRAQSPRQQEEVRIPTQHEAPKPQARPEPPRAPPKPQQSHQQQYQQQQQQQPPPPKQPSPPPASKPAPLDPITQILGIQTEVLNLMTEVENFTGSKKDKRYIFLDEMLTRNLIKLDNIETDGKENIRNARKEAIKCIQKCIAVLEAKADSQSAPQPDSQSAPQPDSQGQDVEVNAERQVEEKAQNGEVEKEATKEQSAEQAAPTPAENSTPNPADTGPETAETKPEDVDKKPKKATKNTKKRDKSKDNKAENDQKIEAMQVDQKENEQMEVDGAASQ